MLEDMRDLLVHQGAAAVLATLSCNMVQELIQAPHVARAGSGSPA